MSDGSILKQHQIIPDQKPLVQMHSIPEMGTSGVRQVQEVFNRAGYLDQFIQGIVNYLNGLDPELLERTGRLVILGGDPRMGNKDRMIRAAEILVGNGLVAGFSIPDGVASTPALSHVIRKEKALAGIIFTASHNPYTDVGIKMNTHDGAPALSDTAKGVFQAQNDPSVASIQTVPYQTAREAGLIREIDTVQAYADLLDEIFHFDSMKESLAIWEKEKGRSFQGIFDAMGGAAGIYVREIFQNRLNIQSTLIRCEPDPYLGGPDDPAHPNHPEPDFSYLPELLPMNDENCDLIAAYDSDGDRRLDGGGGFWVESADEFALFAHHSNLINLVDLFSGANRKKIYFARSVVTAGAIDLMEKDLKERFSREGLDAEILCTATGFKWIAEYGNFGVEESNGLGNPWLREKDGVFATVFLLKILLHTKKTPRELMEDVWKTYGRVYFTRGEISKAPQKRPDQEGYQEELDQIEEEKKVLQSLMERAVSDDHLHGLKYAGIAYRGGTTWDYVDPEGNVRSKNAAYLMNFDDGIQASMRFSGTSSGGYTLRLYISRFDERYNIPKSEMTTGAKKALGEFFLDISHGEFTNRPKNFTDENQPEVYSG